jgi:hypothetical protein
MSIVPRVSNEKILHIFFSKFLHERKWANELNMPKNYCIDMFHYEGHNLWHTRYMSMFVFLFADPRNTPLPQLKQALCELSKVFFEIPDTVLAYLHRYL